MIENNGVDEFLRVMMGEVEMSFCSMPSGIWLPGSKERGGKEEWFEMLEGYAEKFSVEKFLENLLIFLRKAL